MRALIGTSLLLMACAAEQEEPDWVFSVSVSNQSGELSAVDGFVDDPATGTIRLDDLCSCIEDEDGSFVTMKSPHPRPSATSSSLTAIPWPLRSMASRLPVAQCSVVSLNTNRPRGGNHISW